MIQKKSEIVIAFCKSLLLVSMFLLLESFLIKPTYNTDLINTVIVKVEQESNDIAVSVTTSENNKVEFYMFNVEGKLIRELNINGTQKINIPELQKGLYTYDFFSKDERIKSGKIELK
jgi:hypothetical protein